MQNGYKAVAGADVPRPATNQDIVRALNAKHPAASMAKLLPVQLRNIHLVAKTGFAIMRAGQKG